MKWSFFADLDLRRLGSGECPSSVVGESEVDESSQVDGRDAQRESELILLDATESHPPVVVGDEPRDGTFDHRSELAVVVFEVALAPGPAGFYEFGVVRC